jgi:uncharacterized membrane protein YphA (DoxX/SURF4 family)
MFSMFPDGSPGAGLLLLRVAEGAVLVTQGVTYLGDKSGLGFLALVFFSAMCLVGLLLLIGFLTRMAALVAVVIAVNSVLAWFPKVTAAPLVTPTTALLFALIAIAVICLGPGAYSLDARLFGRREIIIPARSERLSEK